MGTGPWTECHALLLVSHHPQVRSQPYTMAHHFQRLVQDLLKQCALLTAELHKEGEEHISSLDVQMLEIQLHILQTEVLKWKQARLLKETLQKRNQNP